MKPTIDNFSTNSTAYALYRPTYPEAYFSELYRHVGHFGKAWDCGTGNGQMAAVLADRFDTVYATDISKEQLANAIKKPNIQYGEARAEATSIPSRTIDLITIAQAIHWFDFDHFYEEVRRVAKPGAVIAAATYSFLSVSPAVDDVLTHFYKDITAPYWDPERKYVDAQYSNIPFPFIPIEFPVVYIEKHWTQAELIGYLRTWSGVKNYMNKLQADPLLLIADELHRAFNGVTEVTVRFPIYTRAGIVRE